MGICDMKSRGKPTCYPVDGKPYNVICNAADAPRRCLLMRGHAMLHQSGDGSSWSDGLSVPPKFTVEQVHAELRSAWASYKRTARQIDSDKVAALIDQLPRTDPVEFCVIAYQEAFQKAPSLMGHDAMRAALKKFVELGCPEVE